MKRISVLLSALAITAGVAVITPAFAKTNTTPTKSTTSKMVASQPEGGKPPNCKKGYSTSLDGKTCEKPKK